MTTTKEVGAATDPLEPPTEEQLQKAQEEVNRLQARIAKATLEGKWNKVKVLQGMLARSHYAKILAVDRVAHNEGKRTPGVDGQT